MSDGTPILVVEGQPFVVEHTYAEEDGTPIPLTGATAKMQIRRVASPTSTVLATADVEIDEDAGKVTFTISVEAGLALPDAVCRYDAWVYPVDEDPVELDFGQVSKRRRVTVP